MKDLDELLKLFQHKQLNIETSGLSQEEFDAIAYKLEKADYATVVRTGTTESLVINLTNSAWKKRSQLVKP